MVVANIFDNGVNFFLGLLIKFFARLPDADFDVSEFTSSFSQVKAYMNYFIPFYLFKDIFSAFLGIFWSTVIILVVVKYLKKAVGL